MITKIVELKTTYLLDRSDIDFMVKEYLKLHDSQLEIYSDMGEDLPAMTIIQRKTLDE